MSIKSQTDRVGMQASLLKQTGYRPCYCTALFEEFQLSTPTLPFFDRTLLTVGSSVVRGARAGEAVREVLTGAPICAVDALTFVNI